MFHIASAKYSSIAWGASAGLHLISNVPKLAKKKKKINQKSPSDSTPHQVVIRDAKQGFVLQPPLHQKYQSVWSSGRGGTVVFVCTMHSTPL